MKSLQEKQKISRKDAEAQRIRKVFSLRDLCGFASWRAAFSFWLRLVRVGASLLCKWLCLGFFNPRILFISSIFFIPLFGCASKTSNPLQEPERFAEIYTKVLLANEVDADLTQPKANDVSARSARSDSVLRALGVNRQQFEAAVKYFSEHPERWQEVYTHVVKILEEQTTADGMDKHGQDQPSRTEELKANSKDKR